METSGVYLRKNSYLTITVWGYNFLIIILFLWIYIKKSVLEYLESSLLVRWLFTRPEVSQVVLLVQIFQIPELNVRTG